jgi:hypothetical protein
MKPETRLRIQNILLIIAVALVFGAERTIGRLTCFCLCGFTDLFDAEINTP